MRRQEEQAYAEAMNRTQRSAPPGIMALYQAKLDEYNASGGRRKSLASTRRITVAERQQIIQETKLSRALLHADMLRMGLQGWGT